MQVCEERALALRRLILLAEICLKWPIINQPFAVVPALNSVLFYFTLKVTSGYSISFLKIEQEEQSVIFMRCVDLCIQTIFSKLCMCPSRGTICQ